jgi:hypothetical protein
MAEHADHANQVEPDGTVNEESAEERRRRRAAFLRDLDEARDLRARVQPHRAKVEQARKAIRRRTFRY